ncbi:M64 family metallopeptidase [Tahibacter amnicola]|uniref:M64 family metallopeptidase n=1 Tax=Tahibacter amnicola TaxID=2976241 RepID=A0ABY6BB06_9GAMM|nr:M64 family metallopeptidase [Tahibacter amnicola]UXI65816.1 M64 family metallopeptidase [Tahibacter amnicola]
MRKTGQMAGGASVAKRLAVTLGLAFAIGGHVVEPATAVVVSTAPSSAASATRGLFFTFHFADGAVTRASAMAVPRHVRSRVPAQEAYVLAGEDASGMTVVREGLSNPAMRTGATHRVADVTLVARVPASPDVTRWTLRDSQGRILWQRAVDASFARDADTLAQETRRLSRSVGSAALRTQDPGGRPLAIANEENIHELAGQLRSARSLKERIAGYERIQSLLGFDGPERHGLTDSSSGVSARVSGPTDVMHRLIGKLRRADGESIANMTVRAYRAGTEEYVGSTVSDNDGNYEMQLPAGHYDLDLTTGARGYSRLDSIVYATMPRVRNVAISGPLTRDFTLSEPLRTVNLGIRGLPVASLEVRVRQGGQLMARPLLGFGAREACSGDICTERVALKLTPGVYDLEIATEAGTFTTTNARVDLSAGDATVDVDATRGAAPWTGRLVDPESKPVADTIVFNIDAEERLRGYAFTDADGRFSIPTVAGWTVLLRGRSTSSLADRLVRVQDPAALPPVVTLDRIPFQEDRRNAVLRVYTGSAQERIRMVFLGDGFTAARETFTDVNGNGKWDALLWDDRNGNTLFDAGEMYVRYGDVPTPAAGTNPGVANEPFQDSNNDGILSTDDDAVLVADARAHLRAFLGADYWTERRHLVQADVGFVTSRQAGVNVVDAAGNRIRTVDLAFQSTLYRDREILTGNDEQAMRVAEQLSPGFDYVVVLVNQPVPVGRASTVLGVIPGSMWAMGGPAIPQFSKPMSHEMGHFVGLLYDEYTEFPRAANLAVPINAPNVTTNLRHGDVPWSSWLTPAQPLPSLVPSAGVGLFEGANYYQGGVYRPSFESTMRGGVLFNAPSRAALDQNILRFVSAVPMPPLSGNWFDTAHDGHGFDFQLVERNGELGDLYYVVFYTFSGGRPDWYTALGRYTGGRFVAIPDANGHTLSHIRYDVSAPQGQRIRLDPVSFGSIAIDFRPSACGAESPLGPATRGTLEYTIDGESGRWCIAPALPADTYAQPDFSGHWYSPQDGGWGMEVNLVRSGAGSQAIAYLYYPDGSGMPRWAMASGAFVVGQPVEMEIREVTSGTCRTCTPVPPRTRAVGRMTLTLSSPARPSPAADANTVTIDITLPDGTRFRRDNAPISPVSQPRGT